MRIAIFSDVHGNSIALDAVLTDIAVNGGANASVFLGDYAAIGHDPAGVLERISQLPNAAFVRGNTDRYLATSTTPPPSVEEAKKDPGLIPVLAEVARCFAWAQGVVTASGWLGWLSELPIEHRFALPDGTRVLAVHASPGKDDGKGMWPSMDNATLQRRYGACHADLIFVGHVHWAQDRQLDGVRVINVGAVANPLAPRLHASYVILTAGPSGHRVEFRRVDYDREKVIAAVRRVRHPAASFIIKHLRGEIHPPWICETDSRTS